ncbi:hypothetical protein SAMN05443270_4580 [Lacrimispora sphenoides]|uniref:hypothetical protein n=1 Tax=Lacrimispora sphenoides TaxID=29370 RepID=UPI0008B63A8B|nr:hypothetical protein [Lacrimispora sphenoides]SEU28652.1 hypothetical protein SAMN05443270_4580 [Lacrimispora sphenoides]
MRERQEQTMTGKSDKRLLDASEVCYYLSLGRNRGVEFARSIGAEVKIGRRSLYDRVKIDHYLNELTGTKKEQTQ